MKYVLTALLFLVALGLNATSSVAQSQSREDLLNELQAKHGELQQLENQFLSPSPEDQNVHAAFLSQPDTGLIRLLPRDVYDTESGKKKNVLTTRGAGAYYSFTRRTHEYGFGSDIQLESGQLSVGFAGVNYGMVVNLGSVSLDQVSVDDPQLNFMVSYMPPAQETKARTEQRQFHDKGITVDQIEYKNRVPAVVGDAYLLRSIDYHNSDVLVVFKVVRKDSDGSLILAWKMLKKYPVPQLAIAK